MTPLHGLLAEFDTPEQLVAAARQSRAAGYRHVDAYAPLHVEGLSEALELPRTPIPLIVLLGGLTGCFGGFFLQLWIAKWDYPINVGGRPLNSWPSFIPVSFELTILLGAVAALLAFLALCRFPRPYHAVFNVPEFELASQSRFFLCVESRDPRFDPAATGEFLAGLSPRGVYDVPA
jgi:hypothetical protein